MDRVLASFLGGVLSTPESDCCRLRAVLGESVGASLYGVSQMGAVHSPNTRPSTSRRVAACFAVAVCDQTSHISEGVPVLAVSLSFHPGLPLFPIAPEAK